MNFSSPSPHLSLFLSSLSFVTFVFLSMLDCLCFHSSSIFLQSLFVHLHPLCFSPVSFLISSYVSYSHILLVPFHSVFHLYGMFPVQWTSSLTVLLSFVFFFFLNPGHQLVLFKAGLSTMAPDKGKLTYVRLDS